MERNIKEINISNILLDTGNNRIIEQTSQKETIGAIIAEQSIKSQSNKLIVLAKDILNFGVSLFDLPLVVSANDGNGNYIVAEGNRRITALKLLHEPDLAEGTPVHVAFKRLCKPPLK